MNIVLTSYLMDKMWWAVGTIALGYGIFGMFYYYPSLEYIDKPFPLQHATMITPNPDGTGYKAWTFADPLVSLKADPYWIGWSVSLYFGVMSLTLFGFKGYLYKNLRNKR